MSPASRSITSSQPPDRERAPDPKETSSTSIRLYTELLLHIRSVTLHAALPTPYSRSSTTVVLSADGSTVTLTHDGASAAVRLPTRCVASTDGAAKGTTLPLPTNAPPSRELALRLRLAESGDDRTLLPEPGRGGAVENVVPWSAGELSKGASDAAVGCAGCGEVLVRGGKVTDWRDLPSENWAEMMEFWHCHKPRAPGKEGEGEGKGYAAGRKLVAREGVGFVDLVSLLLEESDCSGLKFFFQVGSSTSDSSCGIHEQKSSPAEQGSRSTGDLSCVACGTKVGYVDNRVEGWRLHKWSIVVEIEGRESKYGDLQKWISAQLLSAVETQGVRKFLITDATGSSESCDALLIWVFTPDLHFSSSVDASRRSDPTRAMKVFWKQQERHNGLLDAQCLSVEDFPLPRLLFQTLAQALDDSARLLPASAKTFQEWNVGLLHRFAELNL